MAVIKMNPQAVANFAQQMTDMNRENVELWKTVYDSEGALIPNAFKCMAASEYDSRFVEIYNPLTQQLVAETEELIQFVQKEIAQFEETGSALGY